MTKQWRVIGCFRRQPFFCFSLTFLCWKCLWKVYFCSLSLELYVSRWKQHCIYILYLIHKTHFFKFFSGAMLCGDSGKAEPIEMAKVDYKHLGLCFWTTTLTLSSPPIAELEKSIVNPPDIPLGISVSLCNPTNRLCVCVSLCWTWEVCLTAVFCPLKGRYVRVCDSSSITFHYCHH